MSTVVYRPDYAKFVFTVPAGTWHQYSERFHEASHKLKFRDEWLKSHKMSCWYGNVSEGTETWSVDIWGEWSRIVEHLPTAWFQFLRRFDIRAAVWDADINTIVDIGAHLHKTITSHNIYQYSTKDATKRMGRDRGGKGFAIGSKKSDLRVSVYKRKGEPASQEYQCTGSMLRNLVEDIYEDPTIIPMQRDPYAALRSCIQAKGEIRMAQIWAAAGLGAHWPILSQGDIPVLPPIQSGLFFRLPAADDDDEAAARAQYSDER